MSSSPSPSPSPSPYFVPIRRDPLLERLDKDSTRYRRIQKQRACCLCANTATQMLVFQLEGCKLIERYCDSCAVNYEDRVSNLKESYSSNQSTSGI